VSVYAGLDRLGIPYTRDEAEDYLHTWCVVGHLLGIRHDLLPLDLAGAQRLAELITRRHHRRSPAGERLMAALLTHTELSMPLGTRKLPATLIRHMLADETADLLGVPPRAWWYPALAATSRLGPACCRLPGGRRLLQAPLALLGRSMVRMYVDRAMAGEQPAFRLDAAALRRLHVGRSRVRRHARHRRRRIRARRMAAPPGTTTVPSGDGRQR
jgi:hypothetical protein